MGFMFTTITIAALAGYGAYSFWDKNRFLALCFASICGVSSILAFSALLFTAVAITFKLMPLIVVGVVAWLIYLAIRSRNDANPANTSPGYTEKFARADFRLSLRILLFAGFLRVRRA